MSINMPGSDSPAEQPTAPYTAPDPTTFENGPVRFTWNGSQTTLRGRNTGSGTGVQADSVDGIGLYGYSETLVGVQAENNAAGSVPALQAQNYNAAGSIFRGLNPAGTEVLRFNTSGDLISLVVGRAIVLRSPNGNYWRLTVSDAGLLTATALGAAPPA